MVTAGARTMRIAVIPGDGIGTEVVEAGMSVLQTVAESSDSRFRFDWHTFAWGSEHFVQTGRMMPADGLERLRPFDAIYFGAVGWPSVPDHVSLWGLRLAICQGLDQWANVRPVRFLPGITGPLRGADPGLEWVVVRENSEGEYSGFGGRNFAGRGWRSEIALQTAVFTASGSERILRYAFELARTRAHRKVTCVTKSNAQQFGMVLWDEVFARVAADYPDVEHDSCLVDAMAARFVLRPQDLSVVVASNLHADILSDLGSALTGSLGLAASANFAPDGTSPSMFEPVHGSAPDIAGRGIANPIGAISSGAMMLEHLGLVADAQRLRVAIDATTGAGVLPPDLGGTASTAEVAAAVAQRLLW